VTMTTKEDSKLHEFSINFHSSEEYRHQCEVWQVLRWRAENRDKAVTYLNLVRQKRGDVVATKLENDCKEQWAKGNRGIKGDWR
jgi:DNA gyrase/topoisomerase IV subunit B